MRDTNLYQFQIDYHELTIPEKHIASILGYPDGNMPAPIQDIYRKIEKQAARFCSIKGGYRIFPPGFYTLYGNEMEISDRRLHIGRIVSRQLKGSEFAAVFACTIGPDLEKWSQKILKEGEGVKGYIVDAIGSEIVELALDKIEADLEKKMRVQGFTITNRFSPGYCGWPTEDQHILFSLLPQKFCGISLTPTALMLPIKSVSGLIGIGTHVEKKIYPCQLCEMTDCIKRTIQQLN